MPQPCFPRPCGKITVWKGSLLAEVLKDHVREHLIGRTTGKARLNVAGELIDIIHTYFK